MSKLEIKNIKHSMLSNLNLTRKHEEKRRVTGRRDMS